jgi:uncharacterized membrane protein
VKMPVRPLGSLGLGALLMYIFDPHAGRRRRALARDKVNRYAHKALDAVDVTSRDLKNRIAGLAAETRGLIYEREVDDEILAERVRAKLGGLVSHPGAIEVKVTDGIITLSGAVLANEVDRLIRSVSSMRHVKDVENRLEIHESRDSIPGLQGAPGPRMSGQTPDMLQASWSPTNRFIAGTFGGALALYGARQLSMLGTAIATLGAAVCARALTNMEIKRLIGVGAGRHAIRFHKIINMAAPVEVVFEFWRDYKNFPKFMSNVRDVQDLGGNRSHWVVAGPAGVPVEWDAVMTHYEPNRALGWKTVTGSAIAHAGMVTLQPNLDGSTRLEVKLLYNPIAGAVGHAVAALFGVDPKSEMDADLMRMKSMIELGVPPGDAARSEQTTYTH